MDALVAFLDPSWVADQLYGGNAVPFLAWTALVAAASFAAGLWAGKRGARRDMDLKEAEAERLREKAASKDAELAARSEALSDLRKRADLAERNAEAALADRGEDFEGVRLRQRVLDDLSAMGGNQERMRRYVSEKMCGAIDEAVRYSKAFSDLAKYGCTEGIEVVDLGGRDRPSCAFGTISAVRSDYPSLRERDRIDLKDDFDKWFDEKMERLCCIGRM